MTTENMEASTLPAATIAEVKALDIQPGNVVVLRLEAQPTQEAVTQLVRDIRQIVPETSTIAVLIGDTDMSVLTDESMRKNGWVRAGVQDELVAAAEYLETLIRSRADKVADNDEGDFERKGIIHHADQIGTLIARAKGTQPELPL